MITTSKSKNKKTVSDFIYYFLILFLTYIFVNKALDISAFISNIFKSGLYSPNSARILAYFVLFIELGNIIFLVFSKNKGLKISFWLFIVFTIYITFLNISNRYEVCGCGGVLNGLSFEIHFIINVTLILITALAIFFSYENKTSFDS